MSRNHLNRGKLCGEDAASCAALSATPGWGEVLCNGMLTPSQVRVRVPFGSSFETMGVAQQSLVATGVNATVIVFQLSGRLATDRLVKIE